MSSLRTISDHWPARCRNSIQRRRTASLLWWCTPGRRRDFPGRWTRRGNTREVFSFWALVSSLLSVLPFNCTDNHTSIRDYYLYHIQWIFGKLPNGLWPPSPPYFRKTMLRFFREVRKFATKLIWIGVTPPPFFLKIHRPLVDNQPFCLNGQYS